jgi:hypothetical protein
MFAQQSFGVLRTCFAKKTTILLWRGLLKKNRIFDDYVNSAVSKRNNCPFVPIGFHGIVLTADSDSFVGESSVWKRTAWVTDRLLQHLKQT